MGKLAGYNSNFTTIVFADPSGDATIAAIKAPSVGATIQNAWVNPTATFNADESNHYAVSLLDGGQNGTGTDALASVGGASVDWTANTAKAMTISDDAVSGGDWIMVKYNEEGTVAPGTITVVIEWTAGGSD